MNEAYFISLEQIKNIRNKVKNPFVSTVLLADIFRLNTLSMIYEAGSGHIGSSFSCLDILTWLWAQVLVNPNNLGESGDIFFSSKGHDAPALYSVLIGLEKLNYQLIHQLRRIDGLPGHPDNHTTGIAANTGSLGMGISKAKGMALAKRLRGQTGRIYVLTGDGELQEGQIWESLQMTANRGLSEITVIVDHNKIQSDTWVKEVNDLGLLEEKFRAFGWEVRRCDGHDLLAIHENLEYFKTIKDRPQVLIADTIKGRGVSFMEKTTTEENGEFYKFHSGAPTRDYYLMAIKELKRKIIKQLEKLKLPTLILDEIFLPEKTNLQNPERLIRAYGEELVKLAEITPDLVVLDADLMNDCGLDNFRKKFPDRFIECGIAEQDMVSTAGGLALQKKLPIVHSFACFLSTRANEQIYNNTTEGTKIIYTGSLAGLLPATPGHSHQSVRDISILSSIPNLVLIEPANEQETKLALRWAVEENTNSCYLRLVSIPVDLPYALPTSYKLELGQGIKLTKGSKIIIFAYGPVLLSQAVKVSQKLGEFGLDAAIINLPWLNRVDLKWLQEVLLECQLLVSLDDHYEVGGQGDLISTALQKFNNKIKFVKFGLKEIPACGQMDEVLLYHKFDIDSLVGLVKEESKNI